MKRLVLGLSAAVLCVGLASGCYHHKYTMSDAQPEGSASYQSWHHHLVFGLVNLSDSVKLDEECPNGVAKIHDRHTFVNGLIAQLTGNIYHPTTVSVWCKSGSASNDADVKQVQVDVTPEKVDELYEKHPELEQKVENYASENDLASEGQADVASR